MTRVKKKAAKKANASEGSEAIQSGVLDYDLARFPEENPNPVLRILADGVIIYSNKAAAPLLKAWQYQQGQRLADRWHMYVRDALKSGVNQQADIECAECIFSVTFAPVSDSDYVNVYGLDITDRKRAEEQIVNLAKFPSENPDPVLRIATNGELLYANEASRVVLDEWQCEPGQTVPEQWREILSEVFAGGAEQRVEEKHADRIFSFSVTPVGEAGYANIYGRDITDRKLVEKERERLLHDMGERVKELTCMYGVAMSIRQRTCLEEIFQDVAGFIPPGWQYTEITRGKVCFEDQEFVSEPFEPTEWRQASDIVVNDRVCGTVEAYCLEWRCERDEGPFLNEERNLIDAIARMLSETIEYFRAEGELKKYRERLEELVGERAAELKRANEELSQYAYAVSHDIRAPLRAIRNYTDFLQEDLAETLTGDQKEYLDELSNAVNEADELATDLLELSRIDRVSESFEKVDMGALITEIRQSIEMPQNAEIATSEVWPVIEAPVVLIRQILVNLISNALRFNESAIKRVEIGWKPAGQAQCEFFVRDNGIGIRPEYSERIFGMFERLHTSEEYEGTGIGLAIVKKAVAVLSGSIRVESQPGRGSTFYITLPEMKKEKER